MIILKIGKVRINSFWANAPTRHIMKGAVMNAAPVQSNAAVAAGDSGGGIWMGWLIACTPGRPGDFACNSTRCGRWLHAIRQRIVERELAAIGQRIEGPKGSGNRQRPVPDVAFTRLTAGRASA